MGTVIVGTPSRYTPLHKDPEGPGDKRPTAMQIVQDNRLEGALKDKVILMTGASAGIGIETARAFAATGARCFLGVRNMTKGAEACGEFLEPGRVELVQIDTSSLESVRRAAAEVLEKSEGRLNLLVHNAGIMATPMRELSPEGHEMQFATNYLGHFLLFRLVEPALLASSTAGFNSRVVNVSSSGHHAGGVVFDNLGLAGEGVYNPWGAYGQSKTAMIYMTNHIERLYGSRGLHGLSLMPGGIETNLQKHMSDEIKATHAKNPQTVAFMKSPAQGASTTVYAALDADWEGKGGTYLEDCAVAKIFENPPARGAWGAMPRAFNEENEVKLWAEASKMVGMPA